MRYSITLIIFLMNVLYFIAVSNSKSNTNKN